MQNKARTLSAIRMQGNPHIARDAKKPTTGERGDGYQLPGGLKWTPNGCRLTGTRYRTLKYYKSTWYHGVSSCGVQTQPVSCDTNICQAYPVLAWRGLARPVPILGGYTAQLRNARIIQHV